MGRIIVFTERNCKDCDRVKAALNNRSITFCEIDVSLKPERRSDMISLTNEAKTPQIFFDDKHIKGGADELDKILQEWDDDISWEDTNPLERYECEVAALAEPVEVDESCPFEEEDEDEDLSDDDRTIVSANTSCKDYLPSKPSNKISSSSMPRSLLSEANNKAVIPMPNGGPQIPIGRLTRFLLQRTPRLSIKKAAAGTNKTNQSGVHINCFRGMDGISAWMELFHIPSRKEAAAFGLILQEHGILHNITHNKKQSVEFDEQSLYRLQPFQNLQILNNLVLWNQVASSSTKKQQRPDPMETILNLTHLMDSIMRLVIKQKMQRSILNHELYQSFEEAVCELQLIRLDQIQGDKVRLAFGLNLFNVMIRHYLLEQTRPSVSNAGVADGSAAAWPTNKKEVPAFLSKICYNVGGQVINLHQLSHWLLQGGTSEYADEPQQSSSSSWVNALTYGCNSNNKKKKDPVATDPRIHFALFWGTMSSPAVWSYHPESLDQELHFAAQQYCQKHVKFDEKLGIALLPKVFKWNRADFVGGSRSGNGNLKVMERLVHYLSVSQLATLQRMHQNKVKRLTLVYQGYDWSPCVDFSWTPSVSFSSWRRKQPSASIKNSRHAAKRRNAVVVVPPEATPKAKGGKTKKKMASPTPAPAVEQLEDLIDDPSMMQFKRVPSLTSSSSSSDLSGEPQQHNHHDPVSTWRKPWSKPYPLTSVASDDDSEWKSIMAKGGLGFSDDEATRASFPQFDEDESILSLWADGEEETVVSMLAPNPVKDDTSVSLAELEVFTI